MSLLIDYLPLVLFFAAFKMYGIFTATAVAIAASIAQIAYLYFRGKIGVIHWLSLAIIVVFGGATLLLHDETFIKWKPSVLYLAFALALALGKLIWQRDLLRHVMKGIELPAPVWGKVTWMWTGLFVFLAALNWYIASHFPTETWVDFKVWGTLIIILLFALGQGLYLARYLKETQKDERI